MCVQVCEYVCVCVSICVCMYVCVCAYVFLDLSDEHRTVELRLQLLRMFQFVNSTSLL